MNRMRIGLVAAFFLLFAGFAYAQEPQEQPKPRPEEPKREAAPPVQPNQQEEAKPQKPEKQEAPKAPKESKPAHEEKGQMSKPGARPAGKSAHIPDPKFKASFGRQHNFKVTQVIHQTTIVPGQTQFVLSGFTFVVLDPWPAEWLFADDCYIDYVDDEYFLFDVFHPGIRVALFVVG